MIVRLHTGAVVDDVRRSLRSLGLWTTDLRNERGEVEAFQIRSHSADTKPGQIADIPGVLDILGTDSNQPLVRSAAGRLSMLGSPSEDAPILIAGPCSIESEASIRLCAEHVRRIGGTYLRGGAFKPRTSPYEFSGLGRPALNWMRAAADANGLKVVTEVLSEYDVGTVAEVADMVQIGSRNMQNFALLKAVGVMRRPVLLKRGRSATISEWLSAGEHLYHAGCPHVVFCERGIQSFDGHTRNLLDLNAIAVLRHQYNLPVIVDPSHAAGRRDLVIPLARGAMATGAIGVMAEISPHPGDARSDGPQALSLEQASELANALGITHR